MNKTPEDFRQAREGLERLRNHGSLDTEGHSVCMEAIEMLWVGEDQGRALFQATNPIVDPHFDAVGLNGNGQYVEWHACQVYGPYVPELHAYLKSRTQQTALDGAPNKPPWTAQRRRM